MATMTADSIKAGVVEILDRITVLNLCKEAMDMGIKVRKIPICPKKSGRILVEMLNHLQPKMDKQVRYYTIKATGQYRVKMGNYQMTTCPWAVGLLPIKGVKSSVTKLIMNTIPTAMTPDYGSREVGGLVGAYVKSHGFSLLYKSTARGDVIMFPAANEKASANHYNYGQTEMRKDVKVLKSNLVSPVAFCKAISFLYELVSTSGEEVEEIRKRREEIQAMLKARLAAQPKKVEEPKREKAQPTVRTVTPSLLDVATEIQQEKAPETRPNRFTIEYVGKAAPKFHIEEVA